MTTTSQAPTRRTVRRRGDRLFSGSATGAGILILVVLAGVATFLVVQSGGNIYWAWGFATAYILAMAVCFTLRFRSGRWKSMRVIEAPAAESRDAIDDAASVEADVGAREVDAPSVFFDAEKPKKSAGTPLI